MAQADSKDITKVSNALARGDVEGTLEAIGLPRRAFLAGLAGALPFAATASTAALAALVDPIFALISEHKRAAEQLARAEAAHASIERDMQTRGLLFPVVTSPGMNFPGVGLVNPHVCTTHEQIDHNCPAGMWPTENAREHAELHAAESARDAVLIRSQEAMDAAYDIALAALDTAVETVPVTMAGVMALLQFQRDLWEMPQSQGMFDRGHASHICESVETALQKLHAVS
jgi:hypothetical protein